MNVSDIDQLLDQWRKKMDVATSNILQLLDNPTYIDLVKRSRSGALQGVTQQTVEPALGALTEMWSVFPLLSDVLDKARKQRADLPRLFNADELKAIADLLTGPSVAISVQIPFAQRDLLTPAESTNAMTPERVLDVMVSSYNKARDMVAQVELAQGGLVSKLADAVRDADDLMALANGLGEGNLPELANVAKKVAELKALVTCDPLGVKAGFANEIEPLLAPVRGSLAKVKAHRDAVGVDLVTARALLQELANCHTQAKAAAAERLQKVTVTEPEKLTAPLADTVIDGDPQSLSPWLTRLETSFASKWRSVSVGIANWLMQARANLTQSQKALADNNGPLQERRELRGRLEALKVKAANLGLGEDAELAELARQAHELLFSRPTPLAKARELVGAYQERLR